MSVFVVILPELDAKNLETVENLLSEHYKSDFYTIDKNIFLVSSSELSKEVSRKLEIGEDGVDGIVFRLNHAYAGYTSRDTWEWLKEKSS